MLCMGAAQGCSPWSDSPTAWSTVPTWNQVGHYCSNLAHALACKATGHRPFIAYVEEMKGQTCECETRAGDLTTTLQVLPQSLGLCVMSELSFVPPWMESEAYTGFNLLCRHADNDVQAGSAVSLRL